MLTEMQVKNAKARDRDYKLADSEMGLREARDRKADARRLMRDGRDPGRHACGPCPRSQRPARAAVDP